MSLYLINDVDVVNEKIVGTLCGCVGSELKLGSVFARLVMPSKKLGSAFHVLQNSSVQLGLLYDLKSEVTFKKKQKNELISNIFANFLRNNPEDINKSVFFQLKSCIL